MGVFFYFIWNKTEFGYEICGGFFFTPVFLFVCLCEIRKKHHQQCNKWTMALHYKNAKLYKHMIQALNATDISIVEARGTNKLLRHGKHSNTIRINDCQNRQQEWTYQYTDIITKLIFHGIKQKWSDCFAQIAAVFMSFSAQKKNKNKHKISFMEY